MSDTKSNMVKIRIEGASKSITKVIDAIKPKLRVVDESEIVPMSGTKARRFLVVLVGQEEQNEQAG